MIPIEYIAGTRGKELAFSIAKHIYYILYSFGEANKMPMCTPLWFLPCLFLANIYLFFYIKLKNVWKMLCGAFFLAINFVLHYMDITQLPWHFDVAMIAMLIMYFGYTIREFDWILPRRLSLIIVYVAIGIVAISLNTRVDMVYRQYGNYILFGIGFIAINIALMAFFERYINREKYLAWIGRNSMWFMGGNLLVNFLLKEVFEYMGKYNFYTWWLNVALDILIISVWVLVWKRIKVHLVCLERLRV